ncbi:MAG: EamA family transporter [Flavihumibacter sp.]
MSAATKNPSAALVVLAFAIVYLVWGSTYFFIAKAVHEIPALLMGAIRFITAGLIMMAWCAYRKEKLWNPQQVMVAGITGLLLLLIGNGAVIWVEKELPSSLVAVLVSTSPVWFVLLDKPKWRENLRNRTTIAGLIIGFTGVVMLFKEKLSHALAENGSQHELWGLIILVIGSLAWAGGSIYSKYHATGSSSVASAWQMLIAGIAFAVAAAFNHEYRDFDPAAVSVQGWGSVLYLITTGFTYA